MTPIKRENISLDELRATWMAKLQDDCIFISARSRQNIDALRFLLYQRVHDIYVQRYPYSDFSYAPPSISAE